MIKVGEGRQICVHQELQVAVRWCFLTMHRPSANGAGRSSTCDKGIAKIGLPQVFVSLGVVTYPPQAKSERDRYSTIAYWQVIQIGASRNNPANAPVIGPPQPLWHGGKGLGVCSSSVSWNNLGPMTTNATLQEIKPLMRGLSRDQPVSLSYALTARPTNSW